MNYAEKCYNEVIEEIDGDSYYSSKENEAREAIENMHTAKRYSDESWQSWLHDDYWKALNMINIALIQHKQSP